METYGPYLLEEELGRGATGVVFRARHAGSAEAVALKVIVGPEASDPATLERLRREVTLVDRLDHPGIVKIRFAGVHEERPFVVMELVPGETLDALLKKHALERGRALGVLKDVAVAIAHAHERGVVHRDLKPANIMVDRSGRGRVLDFGLAVGAGVERLTATGVIVGTPAYLSPEQARADGTPVGPPADVYALGAVLYRTLVGRPPFLGGAIALAKKALIDRPAAPRSLDRTIPAALDALVLRCLEKDPALRPPAAEVARELGRFAGEKPEQGRSRSVLALAGAGTLVAALAGVTIVRGLNAPAPVTAPPARPPRPAPPPPVVPPPPPEVTQECKQVAHDKAREAMRAMNARDAVTAWTLIADALRNDPGEPLATVLRASLLCDEHRLSVEAAETEVRRGIALDPEVPETYFYLSRLLMIQGRAPEAIGALTESIRLEPKNPRAYTLRGQFELELDDREQARKDHDTAAKMNPNGWGVAELEGLIALKEGNDARARDAFSRDIDAARDRPDGWAYRSRAELGLDDRDAALEDARKAVTLDPEDPNFHDSLSRVHEARRELALAISEEEEACRLEPGPKWQARLAELRARLGASR